MVLVNTTKADHFLRHGTVTISVVETEHTIDVLVVGEGTNVWAFYVVPPFIMASVNHMAGNHTFGYVYFGRLSTDIWKMDNNPYPSSTN